jgi:chromosome segregation ATPase
LEDTLLESLGKQGLVTKARDAAKQLSEQKQSHEREIRELKEAISKLKSKRKVDDDERKVTASKLASYKKKYADAVSEQSLQAKRAAELSGRLDELRKEFDRTKDEHKHFQSQLFEHKTNVRAYLTF